MINRRDTHSDQESRYYYDTTLIATGYSQCDTLQDSWYFGAWANPRTRSFVLYCEGDLIEYSADTDQEFCGLLREYDVYYRDQGHKWGLRIDPWSDKSSKEFIRLGLTDLMHRGTY